MTAAVTWRHKGRPWSRQLSFWQLRLAPVLLLRLRFRLVTSSKVDTCFFCSGLSMRVSGLCEIFFHVVVFIDSGPYAVPISFGLRLLFLAGFFFGFECVGAVAGIVFWNLRRFGCVLVMLLFYKRRNLTSGTRARDHSIVFRIFVDFSERFPRGHINLIFFFHIKRFDIKH